MNNKLSALNITMGLILIIMWGTKPTIGTPRWFQALMIGLVGLVLFMELYSWGDEE